MSIKRALYEYLTSAATLTGLPAKPFVREMFVNGLSCKNRNDARRWLRDRVGSAVFNSRVPEGNRQASIEIRSVSAEREHDLTGAVDGRREYVMLTSRAIGGDASLRVDTINGLLTLALDGYHGDYWGETYIGECLADTEGSFSVPPAEPSDNWTFEQRLDLSVLYQPEASPMYAADVLTASIGHVFTEDELRLTGQVLIPEGREITSVAWTVRAGSSSGTVRVTTSGAPGATAGSGTKLHPCWDISTYTLTGILWVSFTATDDSGATSTTEAIINGG